MPVATYLHWINGQASQSSGGESFDVLNPLDDSIYARVAKGTTEDINTAVEVADSAFQTYRHSLPREREAWLLKTADLLNDQADEFIDILIDEVGSPVTKAKREIASATGILRAAAGVTRHLSGKTLPTDVPGRTSYSRRQPIGVIAGMTPFNVPLIKGVKHAALPLATGNTCVLLPSEEAPVLTIRLAQLFTDAGLPNGTMNIVTGHGKEIGDTLTTHPKVKMVGFTGSTRVGRHIQELCGRYNKRVTLEMGGKNSLAVLQDADLSKAVMGSIVGAFLYQGQICMSSSRIYVERSIYDEFLNRFTAAARNLSSGDLRNKDTMIGPIINERQRSRIRSHIDDAVSKGAIIHLGGDWQDNHCQPTILTNVTNEMTIHTQETFGPVVAVYPVSSVTEAIEKANDSTYGLCAAIYTNQMSAATRFADEVNAGMIHINDTTIQEEAHVPFGGMGDSGFGREGIDAAIEDMTEWKWITFQAGRPAGRGRGEREDVER